MEKLATEVNRHGGIHFDKVLQLKQACQAILYQNNWVTGQDKEEQEYIDDIIDIIQQGHDIYGINIPQHCSMTDIVQGKDKILVTTWNHKTKEKMHSTVRHANNEHYAVRSNTTHMTEGCLKCGNPVHYTSEHHSNFKRAMNVNPRTIYTSNNGLGKLEQTRCAKRSFRIHPNQTKDTSSYAARTRNKHPLSRISTHRKKGSSQPTAAASSSRRTTSDMEISSNEENKKPLPTPPHLATEQTYILGALPTCRSARINIHCYRGCGQNKRRL